MEETNVIYYDNVADGIVLVQTAGSIGHEHGLDTQDLAHTRGKGGLFNAMTFIETSGQKEE